ncbi:MAG TPA: hypothetical protein VGV37_17825 [Aliidongia sp.]|uniref:hypothetical protein n=1 Tax=Aliidongia sp. TaxID=1914230 RepID=UPI002DDCC6A7|nr:hypothetical protein [Aliidongia sp.]HEV2676390.1 hypothetical protein [Aliidongia sp.]
MFALFLLAALAGVVYLTFWMVQNDGAQRIEDQKGVLRMMAPATAAAVPEEDPKLAKRRGAFARPGGAKPTTRGPQTVRRLKTGAPDEDAATDIEEEIIHPLWQGRRPTRRL